MAASTAAELELREACRQGNRRELLVTIIMFEVTEEKIQEALRKHMRELAKKGGAVKGASKRRGDADYYSRIAKMRKPKKAEAP